MSAFAFAWIAFLIAQNLTRGRQWRSNPLGVAAFAVFATGTLRHIVYFIQASGTLPVDPLVEHAARAMLSSSPTAAWTIVAGAILLLYLLPRARRDAFAVSSLVAWDLKRRQEEALRLQRDVKHQLDAAKAAFERGDLKACQTSLDQALEAGREIVGDLMPKHTRITGRLRSEKGPT